MSSGRRPIASFLGVSAQGAAFAWARGSAVMFRDRSATVVAAELVSREQFSGPSTHLRC